MWWKIRLLYYVNIVISSHNYVLYVNNIVMYIDYFIRIFVRSYFSFIFILLYLGTKEEYLL